MHFSNIFGKFGRMLTSLPSLPHLFYLVCERVISACLRISRNVDNFMKLLKLLQRKLLKILVFSFKSFIGISDLFDALFTYKIEVAFIFTFVLNCNNALVVSIFQNCF